MYTLTETRPDYTLAYSALVRRVSAIDALLNGCQPPNVAKAREQVEEAMKVISAAEKIQHVVAAHVENTSTEADND